ncbi:MAG: DUF1294 domain-containing protein [Alphaproteobacteria bacterium]|nr:DUF1294 domain-containing protein [Alphaproteobacteria bacterium]
MLLSFALILIAMMFLLRPLQKNAFFLMYFALMMGAAYVLELKGFRYAPFSKQSFLMFLPLHLIFINLMTMAAYGADKRAAKTKAWRVPEIQLHLLELLGGSPGAFVAQKLFHHKTKKKSFQLSFVFVLAIQLVVVYYVLKVLHVI